MTGSSGYANSAQQVLIPISIISIVVFKWKWFSYIPFLLFAYHRLSHGWGRWTVILPVLAIIMYYCWVNRKNFPPVRWLIPLPFLFILFNQMSKNRHYFQNLINPADTTYSIVEETDSVIDKQFALQNQWDTLDFANFDFLAYIVDKVPRETKTYTYGTQHLQLFTEPIPRKLWRGKPAGPPIQYFNLNDYGNFMGLTYSIIGDGWMSGGWIGVVVNMIIAGAGLGVAYKWFIRNQHHIFKVTIFIITNSVLLQLFRDGGIVTMAKFMLFTQLPILFWWGLHHWIVKSTDQDLQDDMYQTEQEYEQSY
ncbi:MAG: oligosaccharide repeat unit polymerase [Cyanothece sp. SIO1E1]|nr:oligosaccharide repeat unit polymerase [Cyanothece sp. SIO1E1]